MFLDDWKDRKTRFNNELSKEMVGDPDDFATNDLEDNADPIFSDQGNIQNLDIIQINEKRKILDVTQRMAIYVPTIC
jgi:hypothetical protein